MPELAELDFKLGQRSCLCSARIPVPDCMQVHNRGWQHGHTVVQNWKREAADYKCKAKGKSSISYFGAAVENNVKEHHECRQGSLQNVLFYNIFPYLTVNFLFSSWLVMLAFYLSLSLSSY